MDRSHRRGGHQSHQGSCQAGLLRTATGCVVDLRAQERRFRLMAITPADEGWGIGRKLTAKLTALGITTVAELEPMAQAKQQIICSRSFGERTTEFGPMRQALAGYMERAAEKLRAKEQRCRHVTLFIRSSPFAERETYDGNQITTKLQTPTADTRDIIAQVEPLLHRIRRIMSAI
ncbi:DNA polymerase V subunit UmuC [compost metagenome]